MKTIRTLSLLLIVFLLFTGCNFRINRSIRIDDGKTVNNSQNTVNGNIRIGENCTIKGKCRSVNGVIEVGENSHVRSLQSINGGITLDRYVEAKGKVESINGNVICDQGVKIKRSISAINGTIELDETLVEGDITTYNGDIELFNRTEVKGDIIVKRSKGDSSRNRRLRIEIADGSVVHGDIHVKDKDIKVTVVLSNGGRVEGRVRNAELIER